MSVSTKSGPKKSKAPKKSRAPYVVEMFEGQGEQPFFARLISGHNGKTIAVSEGYATKRSRSGVWSVVAARLHAEVCEAPKAAPKSEEQAVSQPAPVGIGTDDPL